MSVGEAITSPTRLFAPIVKNITDEYKEHISALIHNTGGGATKCLRLGKNIHYIKDNLPEPDPIFKLIQKESGELWKDMYQDFNMGIGFEIVAKEEAADDIISISEKFGCGAQVIGRCERSPSGNRLSIKTDMGRFEYP